jgi:hypothetical protein
MAAKHRLAPEKKNVIASPFETYNIKTTENLQDALKDLLAIQFRKRPESELDEEFGHKRHKKIKVAKMVINQ